MNLENMKTLVEQLERLPDEKFWMADYIVHSDEDYYEKEVVPLRGECGTVACIAGWASLLNGGPNDTGKYGGEVYKWARNWLRLTLDEANNMFGGNWSDKPMNDITRSDAIEELQRLIADADRRGEVPAGRAE